MKIFLVALTLCSTISCAQKKSETPTRAPVSTETKAEETQKAEEDCPPGVKTGCNVPTMTQEEVDEINAANKKCFDECVQSRQAEAIDYRMIEDQCQQSCNQEHFVGQIQLAPSLPNLEEAAKEAETKEAEPKDAEPEQPPAEE